MAFEYFPVAVAVTFPPEIVTLFPLITAAPLSALLVVASTVLFIILMFPAAESPDSHILVPVTVESVIEISPCVCIP